MKVSVSKKNASIRATIIPKRINVKKFQDDLVRETERVFKQAAVVFVQTVSSRVPSLTGQARAAFINVATNLGIDPGVGEDDSPQSENFHLYYYLIAKGNTIQRGHTLSSSEIIQLKTRTKLVIDLFITSAHNGKDYFTYWDDKVWHSLDEAVESMYRYIDTNFVLPGVEVSDG